MFQLGSVLYEGASRLYAIAASFREPARMTFSAMMVLVILRKHSWIEDGSVVQVSSGMGYTKLVFRHGECCQPSNSS